MQRVFAYKALIAYNLSVSIFLFEKSPEVTKHALAEMIISCSFNFEEKVPSVRNIGNNFLKIEIDAQRFFVEEENSPLQRDNKVRDQSISLSQK